jgi:thiol:disulfide interchange protein DsbA
MKQSRRIFLGAALAAGVAAAVPAIAQPSGQGYRLVEPPQKPDSPPGKIEVVEFFAYGCVHCANLAPLLSAWAAKQPADVVLRKIPVTFGRAAGVPPAKLFYALEATGDLARLDGEAFRAVHSERTSLFDDKSVMDWVARKGVNVQKFTEAYNSFGVNSQVKRGDQLAQSYRVEGTPALYVDGRFLVEGRDFPDLLDNADKLIAKTRAEKSGKK